VGIPTKALICKALTAVKATYQQSYPQNFWMLVKSVLNQGLKAISASSHQLRRANRGIG
jgi:hypothetical protein